MSTEAARGEPEDRDGVVVPFPVEASVLEVCPDTAVVSAPEVLDAELITDEDYERHKAVARPRRAVIAVATVIRESDRTATVWRVSVHTGVVAHQICQGFASYARRAWDASTMSVYGRQIKAAEAAGDRVGLAEWVDRRDQATDKRHKWLMDLPRLAGGLARVAVGALAALVVLVVLTGLVAQLSGTGELATTLTGALSLAGWVIAAVAVAWTPVVMLAPALVVLAAWREGARRGSPPGWATSPAQRAEDNVIVTPAGIAEALAHLGIPPLNKAIKDGWTVAFSTPPIRVNNRGYQAVFSVPLGVTPDMIADKGDVLARNLNRAPLETWPSASDLPGYIDLWVADPGATKKPAPEYPLLHAGVCDVFTGVALGVSQRGDVIAPPLVQNNMVFGGLMGQGKSNAARVVMLDTALDPRAELWVYLFASNGDFDAFTPRLTRYQKFEQGNEDSVCSAALVALEDLYAEVGRREGRLAEIGAKKVTRNIAEKHPDLRPIVALFSECHELFSHEEFGKLAVETATKTLRRARKTAISLMFDTQSSRADAIPPKIVELVSINSCFAVKTWRSNDGFLGDGSFQAGIRATELRAGKDVGTSVLTGATPERFEILKWFFVEVNDDTGYDAAADVIARALDSLHPTVPVLGDRPAAAIEPESRNLLDDLDEVLGDTPVPAADVPALLARLAPRWAPYKRMTGKSLRAELAAAGIKVASTGNRWPVDPATVRAELASRSTADLDDDE